MWEFWERSEWTLRANFSVSKTKQNQKQNENEKEKEKIDCFYVLIVCQRLTINMVVIVVVEPRQQLSRSGNLFRNLSMPDSKFEMPSPFSPHSGIAL